MEKSIVNSMTEKEILAEYNKIGKIWEFYADGNISAYIRNMLIKDIPKVDDILIDSMNRKKAIKNLGEHDYFGFCIKNDHFETHLYFADIENTATKVAVSTLKPSFASSVWKNVVVADRKMFSLEVIPEHTGVLVNYFGTLFAACMNSGVAVSRSLKYFYREILANLFLAATTGKSIEQMRKYSDPEGKYFTAEANKYITDYNKSVLDTMQRLKPYIPEFAPNLNDVLAIITLLEYQHMNSNKQSNSNEDEDYGDETTD